jgi:hypothetical protein
MNESKNAVMQATATLLAARMSTSKMAAGSDLQRQFVETYRQIESALAQIVTEDAAVRKVANH